MKLQLIKINSTINKNSNQKLNYKFLHCKCESSLIELLDCNEPEICDIRMKLLSKIIDNIKCLGRPYHFEFFKSCLPQILLGPFLNTLTQILLQILLNPNIVTDIVEYALFAIGPNYPVVRFHMKKFKIKTNNSNTFIRDAQTKWEFLKYKIRKLPMNYLKITVEISKQRNLSNSLKKETLQRLQK